MANLVWQTQPEGNVSNVPGRRYTGRNRERRPVFKLRKICRALLWAPRVGLHEDDQVRRRGASEGRPSNSFRVPVCHLIGGIMKIAKLLAILFLAITSVTAQQEAQPIRNFLRINDQFCTGGQPRLEHLEQLKAEGVKAIINLRQPSEHRAAEEEAKAKELGLRYFNIPVVFTDPKEEQVTEFLKITDDPKNRPAFIHCTAAIRVGAFWMMRRVLRDGWTIEAAEEEAKKVGLRESPHWNEFARKYIEKHRK